MIRYFSYDARNRLLVRNIKRPGLYRVSCGFDFARNFTCKLAMFQFANPVKQVTQRKELVSLPIQPVFSGPGTLDFQQFELRKKFVNPKPGSNFSFGSGLGVGVIVEKTSEGMLEFPADGKPMKFFSFQG